MRLITTQIKLLVKYRTEFNDSRKITSQTAVHPINVVFHVITTAKQEGKPQKIHNPYNNKV